MNDKLHSQLCVERTGVYLQGAATHSLEEAMKDMNHASKLQPTKDNEISRLRVKVARVQRRLRVLAADANDLARKLRR